MCVRWVARCGVCVVVRKGFWKVGIWGEDGSRGWVEGGD